MHTRLTVEAALIAMYRALPGCPMLVRASGIDVRSGATLSPRDDLREPLMWGRRFCPDDKFGRHILGTWARCQATKSSFGEQCRELGWNRSTAEDARRRAADRIAAGLNAAGTA